MAGLGHRQEMMRVTGSADRIDGDADIAVGAILEADWRGEAGGELAMDLAFGGAGADGGPAHQVGDVLRGDWFQQFCCGREPHAGDFQKDPPADPQSRCNVKRIIQMRVVD